MTPVLETGRLTLRPFTLKDIRFIIELVNSPGWIEFIGDRNIKTDEQAAAYLQNGPIKSYADHGFGLYAVELRSDHTPIGMCGLIKRDTLEHPDIGFAFLPAFTGKGFAFEIADATMTFATDMLRLPKVFAITVPQNQPSIRLLEKLKMKYVKTLPATARDPGLLLYSN